MKTTLILIVVLFFLPSAAPAKCHIDHLVGQGMKVSGREALEAGAHEAAERAAANAIHLLGGVAAEKIVQRGGLELLEASFRYGDDILFHAIRVPDAARYLGVRPEEAMSIVADFGDAALLLEAKTPGMARKAAALFGREALPSLANATTECVTRLVGYAARADNERTRAALLDEWRKHGAWVLDALDKRKKLILTGGLTASLLITAKGGHDMLVCLPERAPQVLAGPANALGVGIKVSLVILASSLGVALLMFMWLRRTSTKN